MIKVNLLPVEHRKVDGPPISRIVALVAGALLTAGSVGLWAYVRLNLLADAQIARQALEEELANVKAQAEKSGALLAEFNEYKRRRETIEQIAQKRILWSRKLDELADIVHNRADTKQYMVWLSSIRSGTPRRPDSSMSLFFTGISGGESYTRLSEFNRTIKESKEFFEDFLHADPPEGQRQVLMDNRMPNVGWSFAFTLDHKLPNWREKQ